MEDAEFFYFFCGMLIYSVIKRDVVWVGDNFLVGRFSILVYVNLMTKRLQRGYEIVFVKELRHYTI